MNEVMDMGNTMLNVGQTMEVLIATIVVGVLLSLFGLKLVRVLTTIVGLVLGAGVGLVISHLLGWSGLTVAIVRWAVQSSLWRCRSSCIEWEYFLPYSCRYLAFVSR